MTKRYIKMCELYKKFAKDWDCDFSTSSMEEMYAYESKGIGNIDISGFNTTGIKPNGYAVGKKWMNVQVSAWRKDFVDNKYFGSMCMREIVNEYPMWWLKSIFKESYYWDLV